MNKKYWLRGLVGGIITGVLFLVVFIVYAKEAALYALPVVLPYISLTIPIGLFLGWMYGKMPKTAVFLSVVAAVFLIGLEVFIYRNTFGNTFHVAPQPSIQNGQFYTP